MKKALLVVGGLLASLCLIALLSGALYRAPDRIPSGVPGRLVDVGDLRLRILQSGAGPDVVLVHGSPGSIEDWNPVVDELQQWCRITRVDRPGHGWSDAGPRADFNYNADVLLRLIRTLGLRDVVLVGHSFGGSVALALAEQNPPEVKAVVVVASRGYSNDPPRLLMRLVAVPVLGVGLARLTRGQLAPGLIRGGILAKWHPNEADIPAGFMEQRVALWSEPKISATTARERLLDDERSQLVARYGDIRKPVVLLMGAEDHPNADEAPRFAGAIAGSRLVMLPGAGHFIQYVRSELVVKTIREMVED